jgi:hypothetical protein
LGNTLHLINAAHHSTEFTEMDATMLLVWNPDVYHYNTSRFNFFLLPSLKRIEHTRKQTHRAVVGSRQVISFGSSLKALIQIQRKIPRDLSDAERGVHAR